MVKSYHCQSASNTTSSGTTSNSSKPQQPSRPSSNSSKEGGGVAAAAGGPVVQVLPEEHSKDGSQPHPSSTDNNNNNSNSNASRKHGESKATETPLTTTTAAPLCRFFAQGRRCRYGESCRFRHDDDDETIIIVPQQQSGDSVTIIDPQVKEQQQRMMMMTPAAAAVVCQFYQRGCCRFGEHCRFRHDNDAGNLKQQPQEEEEALICGICLEEVVTTGIGGHKKFGLLSNCSHVFCLDCLMNWRTQKEHREDDRRACPTCRTVSEYIVPSRVFAGSGTAAKESIVEQFKARRAAQNCKHFNGTLGSCPFGRDCFYRHCDEHGNDVKCNDQSMRELHDERAAARAAAAAASSPRRRRRRTPTLADDDVDDDELAELQFLMFLNGIAEALGGVVEDDNSDEDDEDSLSYHWPPRPPPFGRHRPSRRR